MKAQNEAIMWSKYCTKCRNQLNGEDEFCPKCGTRQPLEQYEPHSRSHGFSEPKTRKKTSREKKPSSKFGIISVITIVFLIGGGISFYFLYEGLGNGSSDEIADTDGDGVKDNKDEFPEDINENLDSDNDGVGDNLDAFPNDPTESKDSDGDGVGDVSDDYKHDPTEWADSDGDSVGDNADIYDKGNGALLISITSYEGDNSDNVWFKIDINLNPDEDTTFEDTKSSEKISTTANTPISNPFSYKVDVDERIDVFNFTIRVFAHRYDDGGFWGSGYYYDTPVDYTPEADTKIYYQTIYHLKGEPDLAKISYSYDGRPDYNNNERDCILSYTMSIVPA